MAVNPASADDCVKRIFNRYCLGGPVGTLPGDARKASAREGVEMYEHQQGGKLVQLGVRDKRVISITRRETPGSWLNFTDWKTKLVRIYGQAEDVSEFPAYASSRSSKLNAINAQKGFALVRWPQDTWVVSILWDHRDYISLRYELSEIDSPANDEGL